MSERRNLRRRARLEAPVEAPDGAGGVSSDWTLLSEHWVAVAPVSGSERFEADRTAPSVSHRIMLRAPRALPPRTDFRFRIGARAFDIRAVFDRDGRGRFLTCLVEERAGTA